MAVITAFFILFSLHSCLFSMVCGQLPDGPPVACARVRGQVCPNPVDCHQAMRKMPTHRFHHPHSIVHWPLEYKERDCTIRVEKEGNSQKGTPREEVYWPSLASAAEAIINICFDPERAAGHTFGTSVHSDSWGIIHIGVSSPAIPGHGQGHQSSIASATVASPDRQGIARSQRTAYAEPIFPDGYFEPTLKHADLD
jgi:hypothetical protein